MSTEAHRTSRHPLLRKLVSAHRTTAGVLFNTLLLFVAVNLALWAAYAWHDHRQEANPLLVHPKEWLAAAFPGWSHADLKAMLHEHKGGFSYDDYVMFKETPVRGRYVNVSENGFRVSRAQGPWPPAPTNFNVFVFGGSTMFGTWVPDEQTVSSFLQAALARRLATNVCVYNFGTPFYYSTQERLRFERLLGQGIVPHAAVFVDGLNDFNQLDDTPAHREWFVEAFEAANKKKSLLAALVQELPAARLVRSITVRVRVPVRHDPATLPAKAARVIATYRENKLMIESLCAAHGVAPVFVWQPIPRYNYDLKYFPWYHTLRTYTQDQHAVGYPQMRALYDRGALGTNFLWCADLQADEHECLYVDICHYTAKFSEKFGEAIAALSLERGLLPRAAIMSGPPSAQAEVNQRQRRQQPSPRRSGGVEFPPFARRTLAEIHIGAGFGEDAEKFRQHRHFQPRSHQAQRPVLVAGVPQVVLEPELMLCEYAAADEGDSGEEREVARGSGVQQLRRERAAFADVTSGTAAFATAIPGIQERKST